MEIRLRPATSTDAREAGRAADIAAGGLFTTMFGKGTEPIMTTLGNTSGHPLSVEHVTVAEADGRTCGWLSAMPGPQATDDGSAYAKAAGWRAIRMLFVYLAGRSLLRAMDQHEADEYHIQSIAVADDYRGQGIGHRLLAKAEQDAGANGSAALTLDVDTKNAGAERLYRSLGFEPVRTTGPAHLLGGTSVRRLRKPLLT